MVKKTKAGAGTNARKTTQKKSATPAQQAKGSVAAPPAAPVEKAKKESAAVAPAGRAKKESAVAAPAGRAKRETTTAVPAKQMPLDQTVLAATETAETAGETEEPEVSKTAGDAKEPATSGTAEMFDELPPGKEKSSNGQPVPAQPSKKKRQKHEPSAQELAGQAQRKKYLKYKQLIVSREGEPTTKLMLVKQRDGWYRFLGQSALIFHFDVAPKIGYRSRLYEDKDFEMPVKGGVVNVRDVDFLCKIMNKNNYQLIKQTEDYCIFNAGRKYSPSDLAQLDAHKEQTAAKVNTIILPKEVFPTLYLMLEDLLYAIYQMVRKMDGFARVAFGQALVEKIGGLLSEYCLLCNDVGLTGSGFLERVVETMNWAKAQLAVIVGTREVANERIYSLSVAIERILHEIEINRPRTIS